MQEDFAQGYLHLGNALVETGELDEAVMSLRRAAEFWSRSGMPRYMLAFARARQNNQEAVQTILEKLAICIRYWCVELLREQLVYCVLIVSLHQEFS